MNTKFFQSSIILIVLLCIIYVPGTYAQQTGSEQLSLSVGISAGYVPMLSFGETEDSGAAIGLSADLQYQSVIGQIDFVYILSETVSSEYFTSGMGFFGSLGYKYEASEQFHIPIMATGGASIIEYTVFNSYKDVSPQIGFTLAPYYMLNDQTSIYGTFRYMKGFKGSEESEAIDVMGISLGVRFKLVD